MWSIFILLWDSQVFQSDFNFNFLSIIFSFKPMKCCLFFAFLLDIISSSNPELACIDQGRFTNVPVCTSWASTFMFLCSCYNFNLAFHLFSLKRLSWIAVPQTSACPKWCWLSAPISCVPDFTCSVMRLYSHWYETSAVRIRYFLSCVFLGSIL